MFNPQRKAKISDIYMQQKIYSIHLRKMGEIDQSIPISKRYEDDKSQDKYLNRLSSSKREVQERLSADVKKQNHRLLTKLLQAEQRKEKNPEDKQKKHFNSYFSTKKQSERVKKQNYTMLVRMITKNPHVTPLKELQMDYKNTRKLLRKCRKLPSIVKYEQQFRNKFSTTNLAQSKSKSRLKNQHH